MFLHTGITNFRCLLCSFSLVEEVLIICKMKMEFGSTAMYTAFNYSSVYSDVSDIFLLPSFASLSSLFLRYCRWKIVSLIRNPVWCWKELRKSYQKSDYCFQFSFHLFCVLCFSILLRFSESHSSVSFSSSSSKVSRSPSATSIRCVNLLLVVESRFWPSFFFNHPYECYIFFCWPSYTRATCIACRPF